MKSKSIVSFLAVTFVMTALVLTLAQGGEVQAQEGKKEKARVRPTVTNDLNADFVDGLNASAKPKAKQLLALDDNSKYPESVLPDSIQRRVTGTCAAGSSILGINADGTVNCGVGESAVAAGTWNLTGNAVTNPASNFVGTTDNQHLVFRTNNVERVRILSNGRVGIGTNSPNQTLEVNGVTSMGAPGSVYGYRLGNAAGPHFPTLGFNSHGATYLAGSAGYGGILQFQNGDGKLIYYTGTNVAAGAAHVNTPRFAIVSNGNVGIGTTNPISKLEIAAQDGLAITGYQPFLTLRDSNAGNARSRIQSANGDIVLYTHSFIGGNAPVVIKNGTGNVGIGTSAPSANLTVVKSSAVQPNVQGVATGFKVGTPSGTIPLALRQNAVESGSPTVAYFETGNGDLGYLGANSGAFVVGATAGKALAFNVNGGSRAMVIAANGVVGIGTSNIAAKLHVHGSGTTGSTESLRVENANGLVGLRVDDAGLVYVQLFSPNGVDHVCAGSGGLLKHCSSAAEYVPSIDSGGGFPQTADLVSIAPDVTNPYIDAHSPFAVRKSTTACDPNLLGFIVNPEKGADGEKLNEHYLPLAIFGYFPAKVTMLNGAIKRGDPLTSSSKPGYAMKATGACRIIGYALEDATREGQIQVFANTGESSAAEVVALRGKVDALTQENEALKRTLAGLDARLKALEQTAPVAQSTIP